jgi:CheY-like chemotaxis protein
MKAEPKRCAGTDMGLAIVKEMAKEAWGSYLDLEYQKGARFYLIICSDLKPSPSDTPSSDRQDKSVLGGIKRRTVMGTYNKRKGIAVDTNSPDRRFTILAADRNPHVRDFLKREMTAEGFRVNLAKNAREVLEQIYQDKSIDLVIIDPDLPDASQEELLANISDRIPNLPVVIHSFSTDHPYQKKEPTDVTFVEKGGKSIEALKKVVIQILSRTRRSPAGNSSE